ncbi:MAG: tetratricopeptide repeat protein [Thermoguttaceae bacterium]|nr:tetratricopeptide repeat protein [Thermoguttaceae bacterium]MDW8078572.1 tetratricopeptide repeat protein [Thermoguttaceae bacterium]
MKLLRRGLSLIVAAGSELGGQIPRRKIPFNSPVEIGVLLALCCSGGFFDREAEACRPIGPGIYGYQQVAFQVLGQAGGGSATALATADFLAATKLQNLRSYDMAAEAWRAFISKYPQDPRLADAYYRLGFCEYQLGRFAEAKTAFAEAAKRASDPSLQEDSLFHQGLSLVRLVAKGDVNSAREGLEVFDRFLKAFPKSPSRADALFCRGELLYQLGQKEEAIQAYREALKGQLSANVRPAARYSLGVCLREVGQTQEAAQEFELLLQEFPNDPLAAEAAAELGDFLFSQKRFDAARQRFEQAQKTSDPELASYALLRLGDTIAASGQLPEAVRIYQKLQTDYPKTKHAVRAAFAAGKVLRQLERWNEAIAELRKVVASGEPVAEEAAVLIAQSLLNAGQVGAALTEAEQLLQKVKTPALVEQLELIRAEALAATKDRTAEAFQLLCGLADRDSRSPPVLAACRRASLLALELGQPQVAIKYASRFVEQAPNDPLVPSTYLVMGEAYYNLGQLDEAERTYKLIVERFKGDQLSADAARVRLLWVSLSRENYADVISRAPQLASSIKTPSLVAQVYYVLGVSYFEQKQYREAATAFEQAVKTDPNFRQAPQAKLDLGRAYMALNQLDRAKEVLQGLATGPVPPAVAQEAEFLLANLEDRAGRRAEAIARYQGLLKQKLSPNLAMRVAYALALALQAENRLAEALPVIDELLLSTTDASQLLTLRMVRARILYSLEKFGEAASQLEEILKSEPPDPPASEAKYLLAAARVELKDYPTAVVLLESLRGKQIPDVDENEVLILLALAYNLNNEKEKAKGLLLDFVKSRGDNASLNHLYQVGELLYQLGEYPTAAQAFHKVAQRANAERNLPLLEKASNRYARCRFEMGDYDRAAEFFKYQLTVAREGELAADGRFMLVECYFRQAAKILEMAGSASPLDDGTPNEEARKLYQLALEQCRLASSQLDRFASPEMAALILFRGGEAAAQLGQWQESLQFLELCRNRFPDSSVRGRVFYHLGRVHWKLGQRKESEKYLELAISSGDPEAVARAQFFRGEICFAEKQFVEAIRHFLVVAYGFGFPELRLLSLYEAARCYEALGRTNEALELYREIVDKFGDTADPKVGVARKKLEGQMPAGSRAPR